PLLPFFLFYLTPSLFPLFASLYYIPHQLVQIERQNRLRTCHLQHLPQTFLGLVELVCLALQGADDACGLAALAPHLLAGSLGNSPGPFAPGLNTNLLDTLLSQLRHRGRGVATAVVDHHRGCGLGTKDVAITRERFSRPLRLVHHALDQGPTDSPAAKPTEQLGPAKFHLLACLVADNRTGLCDPGMEDFALGHHPGRDPWHH